MQSFLQNGADTQWSTGKALGFFLFMSCWSITLLAFPGNITKCIYIFSSLPLSSHLGKAGLQPSNLKVPFTVLFVNLDTFPGTGGWCLFSSLALDTRPGPLRSSPLLISITSRTQPLLYFLWPFHRTLQSARSGGRCLATHFRA